MTPRRRHSSPSPARSPAVAPPLVRLTASWLLVAAALLPAPRSGGAHDAVELRKPARPTRAASRVACAAPSATGTNRHREVQRHDDAARRNTGCNGNALSRCGGDDDATTTAAAPGRAAAVPARVTSTPRFDCADIYIFTNFIGQLNIFDCYERNWKSILNQLAQVTDLEAKNIMNIY